MGTMVTNALAMRELLQHIFQYCDPRDNLHNALVAKSWSDEALSALWHRLETLHPMLNLLAPVEQKKGEYVAFQRPIQSSDWAIFNKYSWRVHHITMSYQGPKYSDSVLLDIASSRPLNDLFPNLYSLHLPPSLSYFLPLFLHERLADLEINIPPSRANPHKIKSMLTYLPDRCPKLNRLRLFSVDDITIDIGLDLVLTALPFLTSLRIYPFILTPPLMHTLARLPRLECLDLSSTSGRPPTEPFIIPPLTPNGFPCLKSLKLSQSFEAVTSLLESCKPADLRELTIHSRSESPEKYLCALAAASSCCPKLETLKLIGNLTIDPATRRTSQPLFQLSKSTVLVLWDLPMTTDTIIDIVKALPSLQKLYISYPAGTRSPHTLPISILPTLALVCAQLTMLKITMDTSHGALTPTTAGATPFSRLNELNVGLSYLDSPAIEVAVFLSGILKEGCRLIRSREGVAGMEERYESWQPVIDFLPVLIRLRKAEREAAATTAIGTIHPR